MVTVGPSGVAWAWGPAHVAHELRQLSACRAQRVLPPGIPLALVYAFQRFMSVDPELLVTMATEALSATSPSLFLAPPPTISLS